MEDNKKLVRVLTGGFLMAEEKKFEIEVLTRLTKIETLLEDFKGVETKANEAYTLSIENKKKIEELKDNNKWLFRTSVGAVIGAVISAIVGIIIAVAK